MPTSPNHQPSPPPDSPRPRPDADAATGSADTANADSAADLIEKPLRDTHPLIWLLTLVGPFALTAAILVLLWGAYGWEYMARLVSTAVVTFFFFGRFIIVLGQTTGEADGMRLLFSPQQLALMVFYMDLMVATLLTCHLRFLFRLPALGWRLRELINDGRFILEAHPWMGKVTFLGIVAFVTFPLAATGSVGGSIFGRLLGMTRIATFLGVVLGSIIGCGMMYVGAEIINDYVDKDHPAVFWGGVAFVAALILILNHRYRQLKKHHMDRRAAEQAKAQRRAERQAQRRRRKAARNAASGHQPSE